MPLTTEEREEEKRGGGGEDFDCFRNLLVHQVTETSDTGKEVITRDVTVNPKIFA